MLDPTSPAAARRPLDPGADGRRPVHSRVPDAVRRYGVEWREGGRGAGQGGALRGTPQSITVDNGTEFASKAVDLVGLQERSAPGLHPAWQAGRERLHRELQRQAARRVSERGSLLHPGRCSPQAGFVAP